VDVGYVADVSELHAASIISFEVLKVDIFCIYRIYSFDKQRGVRGELMPLLG
jgi:hypothetical protein